MSQISVCGLNCAACAFLGEKCRGCALMAGRVFWAEPSGLPACPIYACAAAKGHKHCGQCGSLPCALWTSTREPGYTDEEFNAGIRQRVENLKGLE